MDEKMIEEKYLENRMEKAAEDLKDVIDGAGMSPLYGQFENITTQEEEFQRMVKGLVKSPDELMKEITPFKLALIHAGLGIGGEVGEKIDTIKKHVIYNQTLNRENLIEELGDAEFYMENLRQIIGVTRDECIAHNMAKLANRYPGFVYTDSKAKERLDK